jgi:hypothetical protein
MQALMSIITDFASNSLPLYEILTELVKGVTVWQKRLAGRMCIPSELITLTFADTICYSSYGFVIV